jgi:UDP:flavonoid glycosyltransferase YjiC (YdhE family)
LTGDITLLCDLPELFPQQKVPPTYYFLGPLFFRSEQGEEELISKIDATKPTILVSMGSSGEWRRLDMICNETFHRFNIITAGDVTKVLQGPHINGKHFINNPAVMSHVDLMICHGGNGTIYQALAHDVPVLGFPSFFEQEWNMHRLEQLGLGEMIECVKSTDELLRTIMRWINNKPRLRFSHKIKDYDSNFRAHLFRQVASGLIGG